MRASAHYPRVLAVSESESLSTRPRLSVIILTWNSLQYCRACLGSLRAAGLLEDPAIEVILIDNGSVDGTVESIPVEYPGVCLVANRANRGVAPARNQGIRLSRGGFIMFLDVDTVVPRKAVETLIAVMDAEPDAGVVGPMLTDEAGRLQHTCRRYPTLLGKFSRRLALSFLDRWRDEEEYRHWDHRSRRDVDYVIGACQLIRRTVFDAVGLLDDRIFYGAEDVDFCLRARMKGWRVIYEPGASIVHAERRITKKLLSMLTARHFISLLYFFSKHRYLFSRRALYAKMPTSPGTASRFGETA